MAHLAHVPAYGAIRTQSEPFAAVTHAFCSSIANPNCLSCTRGLSSAPCRVLLRRTRLRRFIRIVLFHCTMRVEHFKRFVLCQRASRPKQAEKCVTWHRAVVPHRTGKVGRHAREAFLNVVPSHEQVE